MKQYFIIAISEGRYRSHRLGMILTNYFAGIGSMAAVEPFGRYIENLRNVAFRMEVGENDKGFEKKLLCNRKKSWIKCQLKTLASLIISL